ncbi:MAG: FAD-dependent oxidoreductase [Ignavibacteriae bacterium]|nr:FAD-dependent oxidoreductase [Ignavibacteria bacterium]MBI3365107.1 FAD-dependent oxidoreductase [Ignavibacteriota bacterium]
MSIGKPTLVILGTGFGAFSLLRRIDEQRYDVIVVSPRNHFLFTPLLPSTTVGTIEFRSIIESIRAGKKGILYYRAKCIAIRPEEKTIDCEQEYAKTSFKLNYNILVLGVGAANNTYNIPGVEQHALFLKELSDARAIRQRIIDCFERAATPGLDDAERSRLLHFVVVGGGPTGVEFAAEMHDFVEEDLRGHFPQLMKDVRITLFEATDQILSTFDATLSTYTVEHFRRQRIEVRTRSAVTTVKETHVHLDDGSVIPYGLLVWSTGMGPVQLVRSLSFEKEKKSSRILVDEFLRVKGYSTLYALGDCATIDGQILPATAQVAQQEGKYLAEILNRSVQDTSVKPFQLKNLGMLAYIGSNKALADLASIKGHGYYAYLFWRSAYITRLVSFKNKILVLFDWMKARLFGRDISQF